MDLQNFLGIFVELFEKHLKLLSKTFEEIVCKMKNTMHFTSSGKIVN